VGKEAVEAVGRGEHDRRQTGHSSGDQHRTRRAGRGPEPGRQDETTSPIDRQARSGAMVMQDQHAAPGGGQGEGLGAEHVPGFGREGDPSALLHRDVLIAPLRGGSVAVPLAE
jgi:hypothetical protein